VQGTGQVTHLEEPVVVDHAILRVQQREQRVLSVQQHLALPLLLALYALLAPLLKSKDLQGSTKRKAKGQMSSFPQQNGLNRGSRLTFYHVTATHESLSLSLSLTHTHTHTHTHRVKLFFFM
jgi:hypothetical protein